MRATLERFATGSVCSAGLVRLLGILLLIGAVAAGCTSQEGSTKGPSHPTTQTGAPDGGVVIFLVAQTNPGGQTGANQVLVIVLVQTPGGRPLHGVIVSLLSTGGRLNPTRGSTDGNGELRSILTCSDGGEGSIVTATAEGAIATVEGLCGGPAGTTAGEPGTEPVTAKP